MERLRPDDRRTPQDAARTARDWPYAAACLMLYLGRPDKVNSDSWARTLVGREMGRTLFPTRTFTLFLRTTANGAD